MTEAAVPRRNRLMPEQWVELLQDDSFRRFWFMRLAGHGAINALAYAMLVLVVRHSDSAIATGVLLLTIIGPAAMLGAISQVMGLGVGLLMSLILVYVINLQSFGWTIHLHVPWVALAQMSLLVIVTTLVAGLYPARRAMREAAVEEDE